MKVKAEESCKIQVLRGVAIIAVVFIHNTPDGITQVLWRPFLNFSVASFLFLSGMLSDAEQWNPIQRIKKVVVPYIFWSIVYTIIYNSNCVRRLPVLILKYLLTGEAAAIMYYIFVYCEFLLLIPWIDRLSKSKAQWIGFAISPVEIILMRLIPLMTGFQVNGCIMTIMHISCLGWFSYFYIGYLLGNNYINIKSSTKKLIFGLGGVQHFKSLKECGIYPWAIQTVVHS